MYNFHVGVKVCLRLGVVPNSTPIVEVKSKEKSGSWSYRGRVQGNSMGSYQSHNHLSVLQELNIKHNLHYREKSKIQIPEDTVENWKNYMKNSLPGDLAQKIVYQDMNK